MDGGDPEVEHVPRKKPSRSRRGGQRAALSDASSCRVDSANGGVVVVGDTPPDNEASCMACLAAREKAHAEGRPKMPVFLNGGTEDSPMMVSVNTQLFKVVNVDDSNELVTVDMGISFEWHDPYLAKECGGKMFSSHPHIKRHHGKIMEMWPEGKKIGTYFFDPAWKILGASNTQIIRSISNVLDASTGHVHLYEQCLVTFRHDMRLKLFPFDVQVVTIIMGSEHNEQAIRFVEDHGRGRKIFPGAGNSEWEVLAAHRGIEAGFDHKAGCAGSNLKYAMCKFTFRLRRKHTWYMNNVVMVSLMVVLASFSSFLVTQTSQDTALGERLGIVFTTWLLLISLKLVIADRLPHISYMTALDYYMHFSYTVLNTLVWYFTVLHVSVSEYEGLSDFSQWMDYVKQNVPLFPVVAHNESYIMMIFVGVWVIVHLLIFFFCLWWDERVKTIYNM